jgi:tRNA(Ile2) C34 agmatinyltransferase TiaS
MEIKPPLVCPTCCGDMTETSPDHWRCPACGQEVEQISMIPEEEASQ